MGFGKGPFNDLLKQLWMRQAIAYGIDRRAMVDALYTKTDIAPGLPVLNDPIVLTGNKYYKGHWKVYGHNAKKSISIMKAHGCTGGPSTPGAGGVWSCNGTKASFKFKWKSGNQLRQLAFEAMQAQLKDVGIQLLDVDYDNDLALILLHDGPLDFAGNVEGNDIARGELDVIVTDGFTGNVALKAVEGTATMVMRTVSDTVRSGTISSLGGLLIRKKVQRLRTELNQDSVGAGILLGLRGVAFVTHGNATPVGVATAVRLAHRAVEERVVERTERALAESGALASVSAPAVSVGSGS